MHKTIITLFAWVFVQVIADQPDWLPADTNAIHRKCIADNPLSPEIREEIKNHQLNDSPAIRGLLLCTVKGLNVYTSEKGFDADRLAYAAYAYSKRRCDREGVRECVTKNNHVEPEGAMVFSVMKCVFDAAFESASDEVTNTERNNCV